MRGLCVANPLVVTSQRCVFTQHDDIDEAYLDALANRLDGFSGRAISKLLISVQGAVYGSSSPVLTKELFEETVQWKLAERHAATHGYDLDE